MTRGSHRGALFAMGSLSHDRLDPLLAHLERWPLLRALVVAISDLSQGDPEGFADMPSLQDVLGLSRPAVLGRCEALIGMGLMQADKVRYRRDRKAVLKFTLCESARPTAPQLLVGTEECSGFMEPAGAQPTALTYDVAVDKWMPWKGERFTVFTLISGLRLGTSGRESQYKETRIYLGERYFDLQVSAPQGTLVPGVTDLRSLIVVLTLIKGYLDGQAPHRRKDAPPQLDMGFEIPMRDLCRALGIPSSPANKRAVHAQLERWKQANFRVTRVMRGALTWAATLFELNVDFNILRELTTVSSLGAGERPEEEGRVATPERVHVVLNPRLMQVLCDTSMTLSVHPEILQAKLDKMGRRAALQPFRDLVYYWCRRVVKHGPQWKAFHLEHLHREMSPNQSQPLFVREWVRLLQRNGWKGEEGLAEIPGYQIRYSNLTAVAFVRANPNDLIVGTQSPFTKLSTKKELAMLETGQSSPHTKAS